MSARSEQKSQTRDRILESAAPLLKTRGTEGATIPDIMRGAGLTVGGFYAHFPSKDGLIEETLCRALEQRCEWFEQRVGVSHWRERILAMLHGYVTPRHRDDVAGGCPLPALLGDVARSGVCRDPLARKVDAVLRTLENCGDDEPNSSVRDAAIGALALMTGSLIMARALQGTALSDEVLESCRRFGEAGVRALDETGNFDVSDGDQPGSKLVSRQ